MNVQATQRFSALPDRAYTNEDLDLIEERFYIEARENFWAYRLLINPRMKQGWFQWEVASELQRFYDDFVAGKRPVIVFSAPPQHGKTTQIADFISWVSGKNPDLKSIFASFSDQLGVGVNMYLQRLMDSRLYKKIFPATVINETNVVSLAGRAQRNSTLIEFIGRLGSFRNTTVEGQINGQGLDLGFVDDPIKGRNEAMSKNVRDKTWMWLTDDFFARFSEYAAMLMIMTRWHQDDTTGRWLHHFPQTRMLVYPALATADERYRKAGEPLFPEHKSLDFLKMRKKLMTKAGWESVYQQSPIVVGGGLFPIDKLKIVQVRPAQSAIKKTVRYWDKAGTQDGGAYSCGVLLHNLKDGGVVISDVQRGQWTALVREQRIKLAAQVDNQEFGGLVETWIEQEPGSGGLESAERTITNMKGFNVKKDPVKGSKEVRAEPYAAQWQGGNVALVQGSWNRDFIDEHETFPSGKYKDQVDAAAGAFMKSTASKYNYDSSMDWVGGPGTS